MTVTPPPTPPRGCSRPNLLHVAVSEAQARSRRPSLPSFADMPPVPPVPLVPPVPPLCPAAAEPSGLQQLDGQRLPDVARREDRVDCRVLVGTLAVVRAAGGHVGVVTASSEAGGVVTVRMEDGPRAGADVSTAVWHLEPLQPGPREGISHNTSVRVIAGPLIGETAKLLYLENDTTAMVLLGGMVVCIPLAKIAVCRPK